MDIFHIDSSITSIQITVPARLECYQTLFRIPLRDTVICIFRCYVISQDSNLHLRHYEKLRSREKWGFSAMKRRFNTFCQ